MFLDVRLRIVTLGVCGPDSFDKRGLLGVAFQSNYRQNGLLYTYTSQPNSGPGTLPTFIPGTPDHQNVIAEWRVPSPGDPASVVDPASRRELIRVSCPQFNHNGSDLAFGPTASLHLDGRRRQRRRRRRLFVTAPPHHPVCGETATIGHQGDGNAQKLNTPLGKVLRIDVNPPFDVGFASRDPDPARVIPPRLIDPIAQYDIHHEGHSVIAGFVYRGRALHGLYGRSIFGEFSTIFNFPSGPHDYGRLLHISGDPSHRGLRAISEFHIVGGNSLGLAGARDGAGRRRRGLHHA